MIKGRLKGVAKAAALCVAAAAYAAEPLVWERRPGRPAPAQFDTFHGETLQFRCVFEGFTPGGAGESGWGLPFAPGADVRLWYQTNGMANLWWSVPASISANAITNCQPAITNYTLAATFPPSADPGAERVSFFFGAPSNAYAAAQVRFRNSPGSAPNELPTPTMALDFANIVYTNAPWTTRAQVEAIVAESAPPADLTPATNYTDSAVSGLRAALATGEIEVQAAIEAHFAYSADNASHASSAESANYLGANSGIDESYVRGLRSSLDAVVASLDTKTTTNDVRAIAAESVSYGEWQIQTNGAPYDVSDVAEVRWSSGEGWGLYKTYPPPQYYIAPPKGDTNSYELTWLPDEWAFGYHGVTLTIRRDNTNTLGLATMNNLNTLSNALSGGVTRTDLSNGVAALTIGYRRTGAVGVNSFAQGRANFASGENSFVAGDNGYATLYNSMALGLSPFSTNAFAFVWNGTPGMSYGSHGNGTYSINPVGGAYGVYIGDRDLYSIFAAWLANKSEVSVAFLDDDGNTSVRTFQPLNVASGTDLARVESKADTVAAFVQGDDVKEVITNYDSVVHMPSRSLMQRVDAGEGSNEWRVIWNELTRWDWFLGLYGAETNALWAAIEEKADRAWGCYDSHTGGWSPDGYLQISAPRVLIAAGMAYQRHVVSGGAVWVLESNGLVTEAGGVASNGFFRISDDDGAALFEIVKGGKRTVGSTAADIAVTNIMGVNHCFVPYNVESDEPPKIYAGTALGQWTKEDSADCIVNVEWTGEKGAWVAEVWPKVATASLFIKAEHEVGGETYIRNAASTDLEGGVMFNGARYRVVPYAAADGKTYLTLEAW